jgi:Tol biopolymer transport system component
MKKATNILLVLFTAIALQAQIKVISIEKVKLPGTVTAYQAKFSPDGKSIFFSNSNYDGIWKYSITEKRTTEITNDKFSGYGFDIDETGTKIVYRRSSFNNGVRLQEIVEKDISGNSTAILEKGEDISTPLYSNGKVVYSKNRAVLNLSASVQNSGSKILGIENTKIAVLKNGKKELLDPIPGGSYIWPSLSPDGKMILAHEMSKGTFTYNIESEVINLLGKRNSPSFTNDGKWIIYMKDKDDGYQYISSDIYCVSVDGKQTIQLTNTDNIIELNPIASAKENKIVFSSLGGDIYILSYEESK